MRSCPLESERACDSGRSLGGIAHVRMGLLCKSGSLRSGPKRLRPALQAPRSATFPAGDYTTATPAFAVRLAMLDTLRLDPWSGAVNGNQISA